MSPALGQQLYDVAILLSLMWIASELQKIAHCLKKATNGD